MFGGDAVFLMPMVLLLDFVLEGFDLALDGGDAVVEFLDEVVDLDLVVVGEQAAVLGRDEFVDFDQLAWVVGVHEEEHAVAEVFDGAVGLGVEEGVEVLEEIFAGLHLVGGDHVGLLAVVSSLAQLIRVLKIGDGAIEVYFVVHELLL